MTGAYHHTQPVFYWLRWGLANFLLVLPQTAVLQISTSQIAGIIGMSYHAQLQFFFLMKEISLGKVI
jgi:hypothetical protein